MIIIIPINTHLIDDLTEKYKQRKIRLKFESGSFPCCIFVRIMYYDINKM